MGWAEAKQRAQETSGGTGGLFVRMRAAGDSVTVVMLGEPAERWSTYNGTKYVDCEPGAPGARCEMMCDAYDTDAREVRIVSLPSRWFAVLVDAIEKNGMNSVYRITRLGVQRETKYSVSFVRGLSDQQIEKMGGMETHDLADFGGRYLGAQKNSAPVSEPIDDDIPF
jgi:hypothetical protein